jgi:proteasome lid subunit RPN8/RPN11
MLETVFEPNVIEKIINITSKRRKESGGFLIGYMNPADNKLLIVDALTSNQISSPTSVTLDFTSQIDVLKKVKEIKEDLVICGWFHSHPGMGANFMSQTDINTQKIYQTLFNDSIALVIDPLRYKRTMKMDERTLKIYRIEKNKLVEVKIRLDLTEREILEHFLRSKLALATPGMIPEPEIKIPYTIDDLRETRKQSLYAILGWNLLVIIIFVLFVFYLITF